MERIVTTLMFVGDKCGKAEEAINLYVSLFDDARVLHVDRFGDDEAESGIRTARFELAGQEYMAMDSGAPHAFTFTPAISLLVEFDDAATLEAVHAGLMDGGAELMPLGEYPFSPKFAWVADRFGVSWQLFLKP